ncbi:MAG: DUF4982 domain-containing protein [Lachnospiraceae bacterium]|nr:DUF4982 domain-containing protein [Lachnospiraceae bacterium]
MKKLINDNFSFCRFGLDTTEDAILAAVSDGRAPLAPIDIPHDFLIGQATNLYESCIGCYVRPLVVSGDDAHVFLQFDGIYMDSRFYINDTFVHAWPYGYSETFFEITPYLRKGANTLVVTCRYESPNTRWYSGAGIYRNCYLATAKDAYLVHGGIYACATPVCEACDEQRRFPGESVVSIDTELVRGSLTNLTVRQTLRDADGLVVASCDSAANADALTQTLTVTDAHAWDIERPYLYELTTELLAPSENAASSPGTSPASSYAIVDSHIQRIGFRSVRLDPDHGFFLNGRHVKIHGACMHHDLGALGAAVNKAATRRQLLSLLSMGVNAVRTSHNMPSVEFMDLCDELGILVDSEAFDMWELHKTDHDYASFFRDHRQADVASWIRRDRSRPSVIFWSIGNEIYDTHTERGLIVTRELRDEVRRHDYRHHAYVTIGSNYVAWEGAQRCADLLEASGYNYLERLYDEHHTRYPHWCIYGSETSSTVQSRGVYHFPADVRLLTFEDGQCSSLSNCSTNWGAKNPTVVITGDRDKEFSLGQFIWTGWDYIGEPTPYHSKNSFFGQCDTAGFPKDSYYIYRAGWTDPKTHPMVHIVPYWDFNDGQMIDVQVFSNCPLVELFFRAENEVSKISLGTRRIDRLHGQELHGAWKIPYAPGELTAVAYDENGNIAATDSERSFGDPAAIVLTPDKTTLTADGEDMIFVEVSTVDANGTFVADARNRMNTNVTGAARLVGMDNGDSTDYDEYKGTSRRLFSGRLLLMLAACKTPGDITVRVSSPGLPDATLSLTAVPADGPIDEAICASASNVLRINDASVLSEVPVRKIALSITETVLTPSCREAIVTAQLFPQNATFRNITFRALTANGIDSASIRVTPNPDGLSAVVTALGDEEQCFLYAFADNGKPHADVISCLTLRSEGLGKATVDPYSFVNAIRCDACSIKPSLSFDGGAFTADEPSWLRFDRVDFGDFGSDVITVPIFSFSDTVPIEIWEGTPDTGTLLFRGKYEAKSIYNRYQPNTFRLAKRLRGVTSLSIRVPFRLSLHGFVFERLDKAYSEITVTDLVHASGDSYRVEADGVYGITNNVDLDFGEFDFSAPSCGSAASDLHEKCGTGTIAVTGQSHVPQCTVHIHFSSESGETTQIIDIPQTAKPQTFTFPLAKVYGRCRVNFIFLPGSSFDLFSFRFAP